MSEYKHDKGTFTAVWRGLQALRLISKDDIVDSFDYQFWRKSLADLGNGELLRGLDLCRHFTGFFNCGEFRKMAVIPTPAKAHQEYPALTVDSVLKSSPDCPGRKRFIESMKKLGVKRFVESY